MNKYKYNFEVYTYDRDTYKTIKKLKKSKKILYKYWHLKLLPSHLYEMERDCYEIIALMEDKIDKLENQKKTRKIIGDNNEK